MSEAPILADISSGTLPDLPPALAATGPMFRLCLAAERPFAWVVRHAGFPGLVHVILDQQVSLASGLATFRRLEARLGGPVSPEGLLGLTDDELRACGFSRQKAGYCRALAQAVTDRRLDLAAVAAMSDAAAMDALVACKGIGRWTAEVYLLLCLDRPDVWPSGDLALQTGVQWLMNLPQRPTAADLDELAVPWRPHRSLAARLIWHYYLARTAAARVKTGRPSPITPR